MGAYGASTHPEASLPAKAPVHPGRACDTGYLPTELTFQGRRPGDKAEAEAVVDHGEPPRGERNSLAVDAGDMLALCCGPRRQARVGGQSLARRRKFALAQGVEHITREQDALTLAARKPLADQMLCAAVQGSSHLGSVASLGQLALIARDQPAVEPGCTLSPRLGLDCQVGSHG